MCLSELAGRVSHEQRGGWASKLVDDLGGTTAGGDVARRVGYDEPAEVGECARSVGLKVGRVGCTLGWRVVS